MGSITNTGTSAQWQARMGNSHPTTCLAELWTLLVRHKSITLKSHQFSTHNDNSLLLPTNLRLKSLMGWCQQERQAPKTQLAAPSQKRKATTNQIVSTCSWLQRCLKAKAGQASTATHQDRALSPITTWIYCCYKPGGFQSAGLISMRMTALLSLSQYCHYLLLNRADSRNSTSSSSHGTDRYSQQQLISLCPSPALFIRELQSA